MRTKQDQQLEGCMCLIQPDGSEGFAISMQILKPIKRPRPHLRAFTLTEIAVVVGLTGIVLGGIWTAYSHVSLNRKVEQAAEEVRFIVTKIHTLNAINSKLLNVPLAGDPGCTAGYKVYPPGSGQCNAPSPQTIPSTSCGAYPGCAVISGPGPCTPQPYVDGPINNFNAGTDNDTTNLAAGGIFPGQMVAVAGTVAVPTYTVSTPWGNGDVTLTESFGSNQCTSGAYAAATAAAEAAGKVALCGAGPPPPCTPGTSTQPVNLGNGAVNSTLTFKGYFTLNFGTPASIPSAACVNLLTSYGNEWISMGLYSVRVGPYGAGAAAGPTLAAGSITPALASSWCTLAGKKVGISLTFPTQF